MAITYELPLKDWYFDTTSQWTLDYPPFFAYFEWLLSRPAAWIDREMVRVANLNYGEQSVVFYQRATVIVSDLLFLYGCIRYFQGEARLRGNGRIDKVRLAFNYASAAFLILDNIHFQYNSMMYGLLMLSIAYLKED
jgi:alpha-1,3-glucosyltransferase